MSRTQHKLPEETLLSLKVFEDILDSPNCEMLVTVLLIAMVMLTGHLMYGLPTQHSKVRHPRAPRDCSDLCSPGYYLSDCRCRPCRPGFFTSQNNSDNSCHRCFQSCIPAFNLEVEKPCTNTSDVRCRCQDGFICTEKDLYTHHCRRCDPITTSTPRQSSISTESPFTRPQYPESRLGNNRVWILFGFIFTTLSIIILMVFLRLCKKKEKECFKQFVRRCSLGNLEVESETTPPTSSQPIEQFHAQTMQSHDSTPTKHNIDCSSHQPTSSEQVMPPLGNLGPLHIYRPQTVFVSLLNQFGWDGGEKKANELHEETINNSSVPTPQSPSIHLSEEERNQEHDFIFFPSQEQGKECHISKEEVL